MFKHIREVAVKLRGIPSIITESNAEASKGTEVEKKPTEARCAVFGFPDLVAYGFSSTVGSGIFSVLGTVGVELGLSIVPSFMISVLGASLNALIFGEWGTSIPSRGGPFVFTLASLGELPSVLTALLLVFEFGVAAAVVAKVSTNYISQLVLTANGDIRFLKELNVGFASMDVLAGLQVMAFILICLSGAKNSARLGTLMFFINLACLVGYVVVGSFFVDTKNFTAYPETTVDPTPWEIFAPLGMAGILSKTSTLFFSFIGFDAIAILSHESKKPAHIPWAMITVLGLAASLYLSISVVAMGMAPYFQLDEFVPLEYTFRYVGKPALAVLVNVLAITVTSMTLFATIQGFPRVLYTMAKERLFFPIFAEMDPDKGIPTKGFLLAGAFILVFALFLPLSAILDATSVAILWTYSLVSISLIVSAVRPRITQLLLEESRGLPDFSFGTGQVRSIELPEATPSNTFHNDNIELGGPVLPLNAEDELDPGCYAKWKQRLEELSNHIESQNMLPLTLEKRYLVYVALFNCFFLPHFIVPATGAGMNVGAYIGLSILVIVYAASFFVVYSICSSRKSVVPLPLDRFTAPAFPLFPLVAMCINGIMVSASDIGSIMITLGALALALMVWFTSQALSLRRQLQDPVPPFY